MGNYLYNDVELPDIDTVWTDKETYPYAVIASTYNGESYCLYLSTVPLCVHKYLTIGSFIRLHGTDDGSVIGYRGVTPFGEWVRETFYDNTFAAGENACPAIHDNVEWANYDIHNEDGSVHLAASDPVPVGKLAWKKHDPYKPNTEWDGKTFYRVMGKKWVKQGAVVPVAETLPEPDVPEPDVPEPTPEPKLYYLYNDVKLPPIPEWDKGKYPYVALAKSSNGSYLMVATDRKFVYGTFTPNIGAESGVTRTDVYAKYESGDNAEYQTATYLVFWSGVSNNSQTDLIPENGSLCIDFGGALPFWANHDIINVDNNTVYLPASEPVPVYE